MTVDKSMMFWDSHSEGGLYKDGVPVPWITYRCKTTATKENGLRTRKHECKKVTDHPKPCECICGIQFGTKEESNA